MKINCCGVCYSTSDIKTYWCIEKDIIKQFLKPIINNTKVIKEVVYTLLCTKNGCTKVEILRYGNNKQLLQRETLSGQSALNFLSKTEKVRIRQNQVVPIKEIKQSKTIPFVYGKTITSTTQRPRYINEAGFSGNIIKSNLFSFWLSKSELQAMGICLSE